MVMAKKNVVVKKKADDFTVNKLTGKRTLSGAEANRRSSDNNKAINAVTSRKKTYTKTDLLFGVQNHPYGKGYDKGGYSIVTRKGSALPVSSGGRRQADNSLSQANWISAGTRKTRERGR